MPQRSARQAFIHAVLADGEEIQRLYDTDSDSGTTVGRMSSDSTSSTSSSQSSESSSTSGSSAPLAQMDTDTDSEDEYMDQMSFVSDTLEAALRQRVLFPNVVHKHSQLNLVIRDFKRDDPVRFRRNLRCTPETFDYLLSRICEHQVFHNNSHQPQLPVHYQLAIALYRFGHNGSAAAVEAIAQWAGVCSGRSCTFLNKRCQA